MQIISTITLHLISTNLRPPHVSSLKQYAIMECFSEVNPEQSLQGKVFSISSMSSEKSDPFQQKPVDY